MMTLPLTRAQWLYHRPWVVALLCAALFVILEPLLAKSADAFLTRRINEAQAERQMMTKQIALWRQDMAMDETLPELLDETAAQTLLAPFHAPLMLRKVESAAASSRLFNVTVSVSPPTPWRGEGLFEDIESIDERTLTLEADSPLDSDLLAFLGHFERIDGKITLQTLILEPLSAQTGINALNLHTHATFRWLVNTTGGGNE